MSLELNPSPEITPSGAASSAQAFQGPCHDSTSTPDTARLGYLLITSPRPNVYMGGLMVTDGYGLPVHFCYTEPTQPTKIQQVLYGETLARHIKTEVIAKSLVKQSQQLPTLLLTEDDTLVSYLPDCLSQQTVLRIRKTNSKAIGPVGWVQPLPTSDAANEYLLQVGTDYPPYRLQWAKTPPSPEAQQASMAALHPILTASASFMDITEPLRRIEKALEMILQEQDDG